MSRSPRRIEMAFTDRLLAAFDRDSGY